MRKQWDTAKKLYTLCILTEDTPGILSQVARLFSRKGYNIESIVSGATDRPHTARISIELMADELVANQLATQCRRLLGAHHRRGQGVPDGVGLRLPEQKRGADPDAGGFRHSGDRENRYYRHRERA